MKITTQHCFDQKEENLMDIMEVLFQLEEENIILFKITKDFPLLNSTVLNDVPS